MQPDPPTAVHADVAHDADARLGDRAAWTAAAALTAVGVTIVRLLVARGRDEFSLWPDEPAQLAMSRFLGGGVPWTMHDHSTWQPGYATVLSPAHWFTDDPVTVFHTALALNAVLGGVAAFLLVILVRRLTSLGPWPGAIVAGIVALAPAALVHHGIRVVGVARRRALRRHAAPAAPIRRLADARCAASWPERSRRWRSRPTAA